MFSLPTATLRALKLPDVVQAEGERRPWGFPSTAIQDAIALHKGEIADYLFGQLRRGINLTGSEIILVPKPKGLRPLAVLSIEERVAYRALTTPLVERLKLRDRSFETYTGFSAGPLAVEGASYVVRADVASFYQYVDHDLLHEELVDQTGDAAAADSIAALLHGMNQRRIGLPQLYDPSDWLSEIAIDVVERQMLRSGFATFRFNDDFRVATSSWGEAREAIEMLDQQLRRLGLSLNGDKTMIQTMEKYKSWIAAPEGTWQSIAEELGLDIRKPEWGALSIYEPAIEPLAEEELEEDSDHTPDHGDEELRDLWVKAARQALGLWAEGIQNPHQRDRLRESIDRRLLRQALRILTAARSDIALDYCKAMLTVEAHVSHLVGRYLKALAWRQPDDVLTHVRRWISDAGIHLNWWQQLWILEPLHAVSELEEPELSWVATLHRGAVPDVVRARAAGLLIARGYLSPTEGGRIYNGLSPATRPDVVAAIARVCDPGDSLLRAVERDSALNGWIAAGARDPW